MRHFFWSAVSLLPTFAMGVGGAAISAPLWTAIPVGLVGAWLSIYILAKVNPT